VHSPAGKWAYTPDELIADARQTYTQQGPKAALPEFERALAIFRQSKGQVQTHVGFQFQPHRPPVLGRQPSDLFSFGAILNEMLTGARAFRGETSADTISAILKEDLPDVSDVSRQIPPALGRIVRHCLEKTPEERFQSARDLAFDLEAVSLGWSTALKGEKFRASR
jgi:serine/threonine protein kinase